MNLGFWMNEWRKGENSRSLVLQYEMSANKSTRQFDERVATKADCKFAMHSTERNKRHIRKLRRCADMQDLVGADASLNYRYHTHYKALYSVLFTFLYLLTVGGSFPILCRRR